MADAYLVTVLGWSPATPIAIAGWPALAAYIADIRTRPGVARTLAAERALYREDEARRAKS